MRLRIYHSFFEYSPTGSEIDEGTKPVNGSIVCLRRLGAWVEPVPACRTEREPRGA